MSEIVILAGGQGTRLKSVAGKLPKVLVDVGGKPFLDWLLTDLAETELFTRVILAVGYEAKAVRDHCKKIAKNHPFEIHFSEEKTPLGTGGALLKALDHVTAPYFAVMNGDTRIALDWDGLLALKSNAIALVLSEDKERYGSVEIDPETGAAEDFSEKDSAKNSPGWINAGVYLFSRADLLGIREEIDFKEQKLSLEDDLMPLLLDKGLSGFTRVSGFIDIGTPDSLRDARQNMKE